MSVVLTFRCDTDGCTSSDGWTATESFAFAGLLAVPPGIELIARLQSKGWAGDGHRTFCPTHKFEKERPPHG